MLFFLRLFLTAFLVFSPSVWAQIISGKGFAADWGGYRSDDPIPTQKKVTMGGITKACPECPEMIVLLGGSFFMGSPPDSAPAFSSKDKPKSIGFPSEKPQHRVQIQPFSIGRYKVSQELWTWVMDANPSSTKVRNHPVENVSINDVLEFIRKLNEKTGQNYRLPSEAEWEYSARAGTITPWSFGDDESKIGNYAWYALNSGGVTHPLGQKLPNPFGIYDMQGNNWEWVQDCWHNNYEGAPSNGRYWDFDCAEEANVIRGGSWKSNALSLRSEYRFLAAPTDRSSEISFRLAKPLYSP